MTSPPPSSLPSLFPGALQVGAAGTATWPQGLHGVCGDRADSAAQRYMQQRGVTATYTAGSAITLDVTVSQSHLGRFEFALCPNSTASELVTEECFTQHTLKR
jgi:hypothetical protein